MKVYKNRKQRELINSLLKTKDRSTILANSCEKDGIKIVEMKYLGISGLTVFRKWIEVLGKDYQKLSEDFRNDRTVIDFQVLLLYPFSHPARVRIQAEVEWDRTTSKEENLRKEWKLAPIVYIQNPQVILASIESSDIHAILLQDFYTTIQNICFLKEIIKEEFKNENLKKSYEKLKIKPIEVRFCCLNPMMSMFLINNRMFVEPYHYGKKDKQQQCLGLNTCVFEYNKDENRDTFEYYRNHFRYLWECDSTIHWGDALCRNGLLRMPERLVIDDKLAHIEEKWRIIYGHEQSASFPETIGSDLRQVMRGSCIKRSDSLKGYDFDKIDHIKNKIEEIIEKKHDLQIWFQPICNEERLRDNQKRFHVTGYEALTVIFDASQPILITERVFKMANSETGIKLDRLCIRKAIYNYLKELKNILRMITWFNGEKSLPKLFINIGVNTLLDKDFPSWFDNDLQKELKGDLDNTDNILEELKKQIIHLVPGLKPTPWEALKHCIVFEITEHRLDELSRLDRNHLSQLNKFEFALDDVGMKRGNIKEALNQINGAGICPRYIKLSLDLFGPHWARSKDLQENLISLTKWINDVGLGGSNIIAEHIENKEEFEAIQIKSEGSINYYQGFYFGSKSPFFRLPEIHKSMK